MISSIVCHSNLDWVCSSTQDQEGSDSCTPQVWGPKEPTGEHGTEAAFLGWWGTSVLTEVRFSCILKREMFFHPRQCPSWMDSSPGPLSSFVGCKHVQSWGPPRPPKSESSDPGPLGATTFNRHSGCCLCASHSVRPAALSSVHGSVPTHTACTLAFVHQFAVPSSRNFPSFTSSIHLFTHVGQDPLTS